MAKLHCYALATKIRKLNFLIDCILFKNNMFRKFTVILLSEPKKMTTWENFVSNYDRMFTS